MGIGVKPTVDFAFKKIFGSPENSISLIGLLNAILDLVDPIVATEILNPFSLQEFEDDKFIGLDVKAKDSTGRILNVEMQITVHPGLLSRLTYYACSMFVEQLESGEDYQVLRPAISICLLNRLLFPDSDIPHHRFRLQDADTGRCIDDAIEVHTVELVKYNLIENTITDAGRIEQWAFFFLYAEQYDAKMLRELLPAAEFQQAVGVIEAIAAKTEDRTMYDQRMKAQRDYQWALEASREEGREEGRGEGVRIGKVQTLQQLLGDKISSAEELSKLTTIEFDSLVAALQDRIRNRDA